MPILQVSIIDKLKKTELTQVCDRDDKKQSPQSCFHLGGNSSLRSHIASCHYEEYEKKCKVHNIPVVKWATPKAIQKAKEADETGEKSGRQLTLDGMIQKGERLKVFLRDAVVHAVVQFVTCDDQVSNSLCNTDGRLTRGGQGCKALAVAGKALFMNCLVAMRPQTLKSELPSSYDVSVHIHNEFAQWLKQLKTNIEVSRLKYHCD